LKDSNVKVICIDFTGEYKEKFKDSETTPIIDSQTETELFKKINEIETILTAPYGKENDVTKAKRQGIAKIMIEQISVFMKNPESKISIVDLPEVINTSEIFEYIRLFIKSIFYVAKKEKSFGNKVCLVLEEAHTVIPEWNFAGISEKSAQPLLNSIAQIALQGRKYNVGLLVIAQRTANVSKTILTQCNTIVSFQEFDKTSSDFLSNYFGDGIASILPTLKFRQAIIAGKALRSNVPMIFEVPIINE
jgi:DNA helicase HerA-like ATPase